MWTKTFWKDAAERAVRTVAQAWAAALVADSTGVLDTDWAAGLSVAGMAGLLSVLLSIAGEAVVPTGTASLTGAVTPTRK
ncbi:holin [Actinokineospora spheciospongiae]|uniref:holin n=1 Tax=Actinokineospora spheciospongiae TaxID=909613 RepID=UPI000D712AF7|nr:holin [Actinokineospora spheciospongiae]PWW50276.1 r1t family holin [Actinokineospora spheciospongiae]